MPEAQSTESMNSLPEDLIVRLRAKTCQLVEFVEQFKKETDLNPFDIELAQSIYEDVAQKLDIVQELLDAIEEMEESTT